MESGFKKNDLVKLRLTNLQRFGGSIATYRKITSAELIRWHMNPANHGLDDAGEPRIPPDTVRIDYEPGALMVVSKSRIAPTISLRKSKGMCELLDPETGDLVWVSRKHVEPA